MTENHETKSISAKEEKNGYSHRHFNPVDASMVDTVGAVILGLLALLLLIALLRAQARERRLLAQLSRRSDVD